MLSRQNESSTLQTKSSLIDKNKNSDPEGTVDKQGLKYQQVEKESQRKA